MKQFIIILFIAVFLSPLSLFSQRTRVASCANQSAARWYVMPYGGIGMGWYSYNLNGTVMDQNGSSIELEESNTLLTYDFGIHMLYRFEAINLGIGGEWQGFKGESSNGLTTSDVNLYYYKFYGRIEVPMYSDSFNDFGAYANLGGAIPNNAVGENPRIGYFIDLGLYYNLIVNKSSSFFFGLGYQQSSFNSTIGSSISKHKENDLKLTVGYRFWF